jgi:hypothetical protein
MPDGPPWQSIFLDGASKERMMSRSQLNMELYYRGCVCPVLDARRGEGGIFDLKLG